MKGKTIEGVYSRLSLELDFLSLAADLMDAYPAPIVIANDKIISRANRAYHEALGYGFNEMNGMSWHKIVDEGPAIDDEIVQGIFTERTIPMKKKTGGVCYMTWTCGSPVGGFTLCVGRCASGSAEE